jgi:tRNA-Thr(GGU) m(6)t(6)A37 methyltransferase TsaA
MEIIYQPIGIIHTPIFTKEEAPIQSARSDLKGSVEVYSVYADGLEGIEEFSHLYLLYHLNQSDRDNSLMVKPFLDDKTHGVFATRYPCRPNPIGISVIRLIRREENLLYFSGADMLDGTPLLDIKPYIPNFDIFEVTKIGWYQNRKYS